MQEVLKPNDYGLFEKLVGMTQEELHKTMRVYLKSKYKKVIATKDYIVAIGDIPVALVAHMDTVFASPVKDLYYDQRKGILWSPDGLGADDRAGVFSILQVIKSGLRPSIILTTDEEIGGVGSGILSQKECPIPGLKYMIQLDRCGTNDCVFYSCGNQDFIDYISGFGFVEKVGSFSDISNLMPAWNLCGVNLSVGYQDEHSVCETLHVGSLFRTIRIVKQILKSKEFPDFEYIEAPSNFNWMKWYNSYLDDTIDDNDYYACEKCGSYFPEYDLFPVHSGKGVKYYCPNCIANGIEWCENCGQPFEVKKGETFSGKKLCPVCKAEGVK